jgi:hypothetical protein
MPPKVLPAIPGGPRKPTGRNGSRGSVAATKAGGSPRKPAATSSQFAGALLQDEQRHRDTLCTTENAARAVMSLEEQQQVVGDLAKTSRASHATIATIAHQVQAQHLSSSTASARLDSMGGDLHSLSSKLAGFIDGQQVADKKKLRDYEVQEQLLRQEGVTARLEVERLRADNQALRDTLNRALVRGEADNAGLRDGVQQVMRKNEVDYAGLRSALNGRVDAAVLQFHKPQFESAVGGLRDHIDATREAVQAHVKRLRDVVDSIGADDLIVEAKSMHSNLPDYYRRGLGKFTKEELLTLVDVLSFEAGVVPVIGRAIYANDASKTKSVFD